MFPSHDPAGGGGSGGGGSGSNGGGSSSPANSGGGGGGGYNGGGSGGSGVIIVRGPSARTFTVAPGTNSTGTAGGDKIATFNVSGTIIVT